MEASGVWKNLLSGKQAVPTVACPSCGAQVPEFRIHSHLDTCLVVPEEKAAEVVHEVSDRGEQSRRGRGRGRKRREAGDGKTGRKRSKHTQVEGEKEAVEEEDEYARFYQRWEFSVTELDARKETLLSETQKRELSSSGVLTIVRREVAAMVSQLDRLLGDCQTAESTRSDHGKAREAWWEQWVAEEWPEGPLPSGFDAGLPPRLQSELREKTAIGGHYTSILNFSESGGVLPHSSASSRRDVIEIDMESGPKTSTGEQSIPSAGMLHSSHSNPNVEPSSSTAPAKNPAETSGASPGLQACPICNCSFGQKASNREINDHIDQSLVFAVLDGNGWSVRLTRIKFLEDILHGHALANSCNTFAEIVGAEMHCLNCLEYKYMNSKKSDQPRYMCLTSFESFASFSSTQSVISVSF